MSLAALIPFLSALLAASAANLDAANLTSETVAYRAVPREYQLDGVIEAINQATISAQTQGQVKEILFDVDDFVEAGSIIARIKDTEHRARVAQAAAELDSATATLNHAREEFERIKGLFNKQAASESAMDKAIADVKNAQARVEVAAAALEQANEQLAYTQVRAPYAGLVTQRHVQVGEMASPGQPLMTGISLKQLRVAVDVPQNLIPAIRAGQGVRILLPDNQVVAATGMTVFPFADQGSNTFKVRLNLPANLANLYPGMFVKAGFLTGEKRELAIPKSAVVQRSEVTGTYVIKEGKVSFRLIRVGRDLGDSLVVLSGLTEGEQVALDPISAGATLKAQAQGGGERKDG
ncbi:MAG: efflux RND transporter periplasmic adaptor subunit [Gammaproteobacteria bacterium]|nr:MAG: efflux RND transporter periplasmic adaptor subunit [Gammaproteobacteria bacterium]